MEDLTSGLGVTKQDLGQSKGANAGAHSLPFSPSSEDGHSSPSLGWLLQNGLVAGSRAREPSRGAMEGPGLLCSSKILEGGRDHKLVTESSISFFLFQLCCEDMKASSAQPQLPCAPVPRASCIP